MDLHVEDCAVWDGASTTAIAAQCLGEQPLTGNSAFQAEFKQVAVGAFYRSDAVHSHMPMRRFAPAGVFSFTVLREPVSRVLSQIADWRRLTDDDLTRVATPLRECIADARLMRVKPFLERHGREAGRYLLDNHLVRALAASRLGPLAGDVLSGRELLPIAMDSLVQDFDLAGIAEQDEDTRNAISAGAGWCPAPTIPRLNDSSSSERLRGEAAACADLLETLTEYDAELYEHARKRFKEGQHHRAVDDYARFEATAAADAVGRLRAKPGPSSQVRFSVRQPLVGCGFQGRDAGNTEDCAVWTGPAAHSRLYIPVPPDRNLTILLWIRGYAQECQRDRLQLHVDGRAIVHRFECAVGYRDLIAMDARSTRPFVSLDIEVHAAMMSGDGDQPGPDTRLKGICFDQYGWCLAH